MLEDLEGSVAHVTMLGATGILPAADVEAILGGLAQLKDKAIAGELEFSVANEDIHLNLEKMLIDLIGPVGGKLHTGRSRNDQVATDMHLFLKKRVQEAIDLIVTFQQTLLDKAQEHIETIAPGYTHLQRAQPISFAHHLMAYFWMLERDKQRFTESIKRIDILPLGAGAMAGTTFPIDRLKSAELLGFSEVYATGSSIMPQKKNPDMAELIRGKTGRVYGNLMGLLTVLKGTPLTYNKDMQEDKEGMFDTVHTILGSLKIFEGMVRTMTVNTERLHQAVHADFSNATELADYLATKGMPFREAHEVTGKLVFTCIQKGIYLLDLPLEEMQQESTLIEADIYDVLAPEAAVRRRHSLGGTGFEQVKIQIEKAKACLVAI